MPRTLFPKYPASPRRALNDTTGNVVASPGCTGLKAPN